jgi:hypothetical protein
MARGKPRQPDVVRRHPFGRREAGDRPRREEPGTGRLDSLTGAGGRYQPELRLGLIGVLLPLARPAFQDVRYDGPVGEVLRTAFAVIPFGTVVPEELTFRPVLLGMLGRAPAPVVRARHDVGALWVLAPRPDAACRGETNRGVADAVRGSAAAVVGTQRTGRPTHWAANAPGDQRTW